MLNYLNMLDIICLNYCKNSVLWCSGNSRTLKEHEITGSIPDTYDFNAIFLEPVQKIGREYNHFATELQGWFVSSIEQLINIYYKMRGPFSKTSPRASEISGPGLVQMHNFFVFHRPQLRSLSDTQAMFG